MTRARIERAEAERAEAKRAERQALWRRLSASGHSAAHHHARVGAGVGAGVGTGVGAGISTQIKLEAAERRVNQLQAQPGLRPTLEGAQQLRARHGQRRTTGKGRRTADHRLGAHQPGQYPGVERRRQRRLKQTHRGPELKDIWAGGTDGGARRAKKRTYRSAENQRHFTLPLSLADKLGHKRRTARQ